MIIKDMDYAILVKEVELDKIIQLVGIYLVACYSILAVETLFQGLSKQVENLHFLWVKTSEGEVAVIHLLGQDDSLKWADSNNLFVDS